MKIVLIEVKQEEFEGGEPAVTCRVRTDTPDRDGNTEFACGMPWPDGGKSLADAAEVLRWMADCVDSMSFRPPPKLSIVR